MIGIIAAMDKELETLLQALIIDTTKTIADKIFYVGHYAGQPIVVAQSGIGKVNAAVTATLLLDHFPVDFLVNTGLAGGISPTKTGDIVLSTGVAYSDVDFTPVNPELPFGQMEGEPFVVQTDAALLRTAEKVLTESKTPYRAGFIVSGDTFVTSISQLKPVMNHLKGIVACEMEGMAVAATARHFGVPVLIMRGISDVIDAPSQIHDYYQIAQTIAAKTTTFVLSFIERWNR